MISSLTHLWELLGGENWRESESEFCPGEMEAPKVLPCLAFILRLLFFYPLYIRSKSDHSCPMADWLQLLQPAHSPLSFRDLCWAKHAGALTGNTQNSKFTSMTIVQIHPLMLYFPVRSTWDWTYLSISTYGGAQALLPCTERFCMNILWPSILSIILSLLKFFFYRNMSVQTKKSNYQDFQVSLENVSIITLAPELPGALEVEQTRIFFLGSPMFSSPIYLLELCTFFVRW